MWEAGLFAVLLLATAAGWLLGRYGSRLWRFSVGTQVANSRVSNAGLYKGLDFLLKDKPDEAIEAFIHSLEINRETLELHLALGNLLRRKGEVDRAIRIHQNLLEKAGQNVAHSQQIQLELARDFVSAGLLDRAEQLLLELVPLAAEVRETCIGLLIEIYQSEKEWSKAIDVSGWLTAGRTVRKTQVADDAHVSLAHFHCELAEQALLLHHVGVAQKHIREALKADRRCVRASLLQGRLWLGQQHPRRAVRALRKIEFQQPDLLPETIPMLADAFARIGDRNAFCALLQRWVDKFPRSSLVLALTAELERERGDVAAAQLLSEQLKSRPSLRGLNQLIDYHLQHSDGSARENLGLLKTLIGNLVAAKPAFQCDHCGFAGQRLHWLCPGCKKWGRIKPIAGVEGE